MARAGQIKALAITAAKRSALAPDIRTAAESGMPGLEFGSWYGVWGPRDLPSDIVARLNAALNDATRDLAYSGRHLGIESVAETPEEFARFIAIEVTRGTDLASLRKFQAGMILLSRRNRAKRGAAGRRLLRKFSAPSRPDGG